MDVHDWQDRLLLEAFHLMWGKEKDLFLETALVQTEGRRGKATVINLQKHKEIISSGGDSLSAEQQA